MSDFTFTTSSVTVAGKTFPAEYSITTTGDVMAFVQVPGADAIQRVRFPVDHPDHAAALAAAQAERAAHAAEAAKKEPAPEAPTRHACRVGRGERTTTDEAGQQAGRANLRGSFDDAAQAVADAAHAAYVAELDRITAAAPTPVPQQDAADGTFPGWTGELHQGKARAKRIDAAKNIRADWIELDRKSRSAEICGERYTHKVTMQRCTCGDFIRYKMPCKHMYRLAHDLGLLDQDWNAAAPVPATGAPGAGQAAQQEPAPAHQDAPETVTTAPAKDFIGQTITGNGWRILFDGEAGRTRVIFDAAPTAAAAAALEKAGFYFSKVMGSYNKKLTHKAHRAALALSGELAAIYA